MITIGLDLRGTEKGFKAHYGRGTGRYAGEVAKQLSGPTSASPFTVKHVFAKDLGHSLFEKSFLGITPVGKVTLETQFLLPQKISRLGVDLMHFFAHGDAPVRSKVPYIVTVLDLIPLKFPELYKANKPTWRYRLARYLELQAIRNAKGILAISECTKRDLIDLLGVDPARIYVTPLASQNGFRERDLGPGAITNRNAKREELELPLDRPVLLYVGGIDPRKNITFLLEVFAEMLREAPKNAKPLLVMAGGYQVDPFHYPQLVRDIQRLGIGNDVRLPGFVSDDTLEALYHAADLMVFPSLYEGFGLPVLEAMASGLPVVAGNNSSIPEVAGKSALLLPDNDRSRWTREVLSLLNSPERQTSMAREGLARARQFSWEETAKKTLDAYSYFAKNIFPDKWGRANGAKVIPIDSRTRKNAALG